ncbi:MAG: stage sporulation protein SpoIID [Candidatus Taylorbacteria bacterium]|nr:stage sporulation protein SpoIID [Candidatus Taylorbacteria bacterium]
MKKYTKIGLYLVIALAFFSFGRSSNAADTLQFQYDMRAGSESSDVALLQGWLMNHGYDIPALRSNGIAKGYFGSQTKTAVIKFQAVSGIPATGVVGPITRGKINAFTQIQTGDFSLSIMSPNGGETWESGSAHRIQWNLVTMLPPTDKANETHLDLYLEKKVDQYVVMNANAAATATTATSATINQCPVSACPWIVAPIVLDKNIAASTVYNWVVGTDEKNAAVAPGQYKVVACVAGSMTICDRSNDFFTITPSAKPQQASITTVSPNGGEIWKQNSVQTIQWDFSKSGTDSQNYMIDINIQTAGDINFPDLSKCPIGYTCDPLPTDGPRTSTLKATVAKNIPAQQKKYIWTVGSISSGNMLAPGRYSMKICFAGTDNCAVSDTAFTISTQLLMPMTPNSI